MSGIVDFSNGQSTVAFILGMSLILERILEVLFIMIFGMAKTKPSKDVMQFLAFFIGGGVGIGLGALAFWTYPDTNRTWTLWTSLLSAGGGAGIIAAYSHQLISLSGKLGGFLSAGAAAPAGKPLTSNPMTSAA